MSRIQTLKDLRVVQLMPQLAVQGLLTDANYFACMETIRQTDYTILGLQNAVDYYQKGRKVWSKFYMDVDKEQNDPYIGLAVEEVNTDVIENGELVAIETLANFYDINDTVALTKGWHAELTANQANEIHSQRIERTLSQMVGTAPHLMQPDGNGGFEPIAFLDNLLIPVSVEDVLKEIFIAYNDEIDKYKNLRDPSYWITALDNEINLRLLEFLTKTVTFQDATGAVLSVPFRELIKAELYDPNNL